MEPSVQIGFGNSSINQQSQVDQRNFNNRNSNYRNNQYGERTQNQNDYRNNDNRGNNYGERTQNQNDYRNNDNRGNNYRERTQNQNDYRNNDNRGNNYGERTPNYQNNNSRGPFRNNRGGGQFRTNFNNSNDNTYNYYSKQVEDPIFTAKYRTEIDLILHCFPNLTEKDSIDLMKRFEQNTAQTIFESLNEISKENYCKKRSYNTLFFHNMDIFETKDLKYLQDTHEQILKYYKVYKQTDSNAIQDLPEHFYYINESEKRRKLSKNEEGVYNYLPILCTVRHEDSLSKDKCNYAHTDNEINYHSLQYHTKICRKKEECKLNNGLCNDSHGIEEDFRIIFDYQLKEICLLMNKLAQKLPKIDAYEKYLSKDNCFNLNSFKVNKCVYGANCNLNYHSCLNYHQDNERRRPPLLFRYSYEMCTNAKENNSLQFNPQSCEMGDHCPFIHRIYEYYYHEKIFRNIVPCKMEEERGQCAFPETCYKIHNGYYDEEYEDKKKRLKRYKSIIQGLKCPVCGVPSEKNTYVLIKCSHILCLNCFSKSTSKKRCPECKTEYNKGENYCINMAEPFVSKTIITNEDRSKEEEKEIQYEDKDIQHTDNQNNKKKKKKKQQQKQHQQQIDDSDENNETFP